MSSPFRYSYDSLGNVPATTAQAIHSSAVGMHEITGAVVKLN